VLDESNLPFKMFSSEGRKSKAERETQGLSVIEHVEAIVSRRVALDQLKNYLDKFL
jgi:hypothetical protein